MNLSPKAIACFIGLSIISFCSFSQTQKFVVSSKIYFDANFNPRITVTYQNVSKKDISQIMSSFIYNNYSDWDNTSMSRSLREAATVRVIRNVNIPPGKSYKDDFAITPLDGYEGKSPIGHISKIRFSDGSIQSFD
ncbi:hypothetical protein ABIB62_003777 [Mucilaginibacter sp. UYP25]|uniref:hypothetical protein n=1 Tax=unclassified Mucilaginibacter TaxID=2617802 RepID=UPI0033915A52